MNVTLLVDFTISSAVFKEDDFKLLLYVKAMNGLNGGGCDRIEHLPFPLWL